MAKKAITVPGTKLYGPYTPGVKANGLIWLSGQIDVEAGNDTASQTAGALAKIDALLEAAGVTKDAVCFAQVLLDDIGDFQEMNEVYGAWVDSMEVKPARAAFEAAALPAGAKVEIVVQAIDTNH
ncbi:MAG: reactive intermediate/imine deaminase [Euryarchaeota archaeon]|nr:reactive intermediate/imine deaminase [Euryarchaeota archaeon]|tara:strand:- start:141 stop:515 length:375 start_codon:yes stop_codon:yes gene_type:complete